MKSERRADDEVRWRDDSLYHGMWYDWQRLTDHNGRTDVVNLQKPEPKEAATETAKLPACKMMLKA